MEKENLQVAISGGRSSAMMSYLIHTSKKYKNYNPVYIFCNTGLERPETIEFLKDIEKYWGIEIHFIQGVYSLIKGVGVKAIRVKANDLDMKGKTFFKMVKHFNKHGHKGLPSSAMPYCSGYLKQFVAHAYLRDQLNIKKYKIALGFRAEDMPKRVSWAEVNQSDKYIYPLLTHYNMPINNKSLNKFWSKQKFRLRIDSALGNCALCWKKSEKNLIQNLRVAGHNAEMWEELEKRFNDTSFRDYRSITDLVKLAESGVQLKAFSDEDLGACFCGG